MVSLTLSSSRIISAIPGLISNSSGWCIDSCCNARLSSVVGSGKAAIWLDVGDGCECDWFTDNGDDVSKFSGDEFAMLFLSPEGHRLFRWFFVDGGFSASIDASDSQSRGVILAFFVSFFSCFWNCWAWWLICSSMSNVGTGDDSTERDFAVKSTDGVCFGLICVSAKLFPIAFCSLLTSANPRICSISAIASSGLIWSWFTFISPLYINSTIAFNSGHLTSRIIMIGCWHGLSKNSDWK